MLQRPYIIVLAVISFATVFVGLSHPREVVFDEVHFGKFVTAYCCSGERFFDIHPPHGKLLIAGTAYLLGYKEKFSFEHIGLAYSATPVVALRFLPALAGALVPLVVFAILATLGVSRPYAALGGLASALDNALTIQSRVIGLDSLLLLSSFSSLWLFLLWLQRGHDRHRVWFLVGAGALAGLAAGIKFTGLAALAVIGIVQIFLLLRTLWRFGKDRDTWKHSALQYIAAGLVTLASAFLVYALGWVLHFTILDKPGPGDAWSQRTGNLVQDIIQEHKSMLGANYNLGADHPYGSKWWTWPALARPVFYWSGSEGAWIYFQGNPVVWWGSAVLFIGAMVSFLIDPSLRRRQPLVAILLLGYVVAYVPFMRVPRVLFLYHYLTPLTFTTMFAVWWLDIIPISLQRKKLVWWIAIILLVAGFVHFSPITYGINAWQQQLVWFDKWR